MINEFKSGDEIKHTSGDNIIIKSKIGEGGQGKVYKVEYLGEEYALKWYFPKKLKEPKKFYENLRNNVINGNPSKEFLWPLAITEKQNGSFGYIMDLRPKEYRDLTCFLNASIKYKTTEAVINTCLNMVNAFQALHRKGYSYQDLNDGNFFVNPENGDILICDNDNVAPYGASFGIAGKSRYMAPEVVLENTKPNLDTDLFSLSVILFMLIFIAHPLEGARVVACPCLTEDFEVKLYAEEPVFIWDPKDTSNRPVRGIHNNAIKLWPLFPKYLQDAFIRSFVSGTKDIRGRLRETEWREIFLKLKDDILKCFNCNEENFASMDDNGIITCCNCGNRTNKPLSLSGNNFEIALVPEKNLTAWHIDNGDYSEIMGTVVRNKNNPHLWGIRNLSKHLWTVTYPNSKNEMVKENQVVPILKNINIKIRNQGFNIK